MQRTLIASLALALALSSIGCAPRRYYDYDHDRWGSDRYERHQPDRDRDGLAGRLDLNRASTRDLDRLPGLSADDAHRIVANRPYDDKRALIDRRIIGPRKYGQIEDFVYAGRTRQDRYDDDRHGGDRQRPYYGDDTRYQDRRFFDDR